MAGVGDCFTIGSTVSCTTCFHQIIEGEVLAFDHTTKMLILKCKANGSVKLNDVFIVNLALCSDVQVKKEVSLQENKQLQSLNLQRLNTRIRNTVEEKRRLVQALNAGVSPDGQKLFLVISKTISEVTWSGPNIVVFSDVTITPPYKVDNVTGNPDSRQLTYVKKIVEKYTNDQQSGGESSGSSAAPSSSNSTVSAN